MTDWIEWTGLIIAAVGVLLMTAPSLVNWIIGRS